MANISTVAVRFVASVQEFSQGLARMTKETKWFSAGLEKDVKNAGATLAKLGTAAAAAGTAIAVGLAAGSAKAVKELASINDEARKLDMSAEAFQVLGSIANDAGVETGTLRQGYVELTKALAEVTNGSSETIQTFNELGISADRLRSLTPEQKLAAVADKLTAITDVNEKNRLGMALFGKAWTDIKVVLDGGSAAMADAAASAASLGKIMSSEDVANAKELQNTFNDLEEVLTSAFNVIAATVAPILTEYISKFLEWLKEGSNLADTFQTALYGLMTPVYMIAKGVDALIATFYTLRGVTRILETGLLQLVTWYLDGVAFMSKGFERFINLMIAGWNKLPFNKKRQIAELNFSSNIEKLAGELQSKTEGMAQSASDDFTKAGEAWENGYAEKVLTISGKLTNVVSSVTAKGKEAGTAVANSMRNMGDAVTGVTEDFDALFKYFDRMEHIAEKYNSSAKLREEIADIQELIAFQNQYGVTLADNGELEEALLQKQQELWEQGHQTFSKFKGVIQNFGDGFADALVNARSFSDVLKQLEKEIIAVAIRQFFLRQAFNIAGSFFGAPALGEMMYGGGRASGGPVQAGVAYTVGESGREKFVPTTNGVILPNNFNGGGDNTSVNITLNVQTGVSQTVRAEMANLLPAMKREILAGVLDAKIRGGYFAKTIAA